MKISWNWLQELLPVNSSVEVVSNLLTDIGLEVEGVYPYSSIPGNLEGLITGEVVSVEAHPNADKLKVTQVDIGDGQTLQIVCGAPNVAINQKVIVAQVGTTIHPINGESFTIRKAKLRGESSEGMICAEDEVGLGDDHDGITVLPDDTKIGIPLSDIYKVYQDQIIEIGLTANHADAFSIWGTALEAAAGLSVRNIENCNAKFPKSTSISSNQSPIQVEVENSSACPRYSGVVIEGIKVEASPEWMQHKLQAMGIRPINNVVDITNYVLLELGQPLHAFDIEAISGKQIKVGHIEEKSKFKGLDENEYIISSNDLMIKNSESAMCIAGVFGGIDSGVNEHTTSIFLESAFFSGEYVRKTESRLSLRTDASQRFGKGTDPEMTVAAIERAIFLFEEICGAKPQGGIIDIYPEKIQPAKIGFRPNYLKRIVGSEIEDSQIAKALNAVQIEIKNQSSETWNLTVPARKNDVLREIDIVEEVLRLVSYNSIPLPDSVKTPFTLRPNPNWESTRLNAGRHLTSRGFYEIFTNSISKSEYVKKWMPDSSDQVILLMNSLNAELDSMRPSTLFSVLETVSFNQNRKQNNLKLYEFGKIFNKQGAFNSETSVLSLCITGNINEESWRADQRKANLFDLKEEITRLSNHLKVPFITSPIDNHPLLDEAIALVYDNEVNGVFGKVKTSLTSSFGIKQDIFFAELFWVKWAQLANRSTNYKPISKFPEIRRDLALLLDKNVPYDKVKKTTMEQGGNTLKQVSLFDIYTGEKTKDKKSYAISLVFSSDEKTLTDKEIDVTMKKVIKALEKEAGATIRS